MTAMERFEKEVPGFAPVTSGELSGRFGRPRHAPPGGLDRPGARFDDRTPRS